MMRIGITQRLLSDDITGEIRSGLDIRWYHLFDRAGWYPVVIPIYKGILQYLEESGLDGIIISGGNDLSIIAPSPLSRMRDEIEMDVIDWSITNGLPLFGVCRGMQIIAEYFGSTLERVEGHVSTTHSLNVSKESTLYRLMRSLKEVNSFHRYGVTSVNDGFIVSATSPDGVIEAFEHREYRIYGQMWHPERNEPFSNIDLNFMSSFFDGG